MSDQSDGSAQPPTQNEQTIAPEAQAPEGKKPEESKENGDAPVQTDDDKQGVEKRIAQSIARARSAEAELKALRDEKKSKEEKELLEKGEHQKVIDNLKDQLNNALKGSERIKELESSLEGHLNVQMEKIPEEKKGLIPSSFTIEQKLDYISKNSNLLLAEKKIVNAGSSLPKNDSTVNANKQDLEDQFDKLMELKRSSGFLQDSDMAKLDELTKKLNELDKAGV